MILRTWSSTGIVAPQNKSPKKKLLAQTGPYGEKAIEVFSSSGGKVVGSFHLDVPVLLEVMKLAKWMFSPYLEWSYTLVKFGKMELFRSSMWTLTPERDISGDIITCFSRVLTHEERQRQEVPQTTSIWYMPTQISEAYLGKGRPVEDYSMLVPVFVTEIVNHWFLVAVNIINRCADICDPLVAARSKTVSTKATKEMLSTLDRLFKSEIKQHKQNDFQFSNFKVSIKSGTPQQDNGHDCGVYVMKFMESFKREESMSPFAPVDERLKIACQLVKHDRNEVRAVVFADKEKYYMQQTPLPVGSPVKTHSDPRFSTKKLKSKNSIPTHPVPTRTSGRLKRIKYEEYLIKPSMFFGISHAHFSFSRMY
ncbi:uncharacterized protein LOC133818671 isoform X2 [Humulus lupulus]|uniref:uncharacterized protein LOC133818671 isoform X2 n=1 Tax=Humulus lupulus TaxID=3486 RepID=UPI002B41520D|nr:uncharacterized protein LOC133818671 isoform X2 [Humulus lupulus]